MELDLRELLIGLGGGLALFLLGLNLLSDALKEVAGEKVKRWLGRLTVNRWAGLATGTGATVLLDSSSATTILTVSLVNAGLMPFARSLAVVLGANIGTTFSSLIIAFKATDYAPVVLFVGFVLRYLTKSARLKKYGSLLLALGLVFFGLSVMGKAMEPVKDAPFFQETMKQLENPLLAVLAGAALTALIQSSSAMMGIVIILADQGALPLPVGIGLMMGAEIGTCADTLLASVGRSRAALRTGVFQLLFNVASVLVWVGFTMQLAALVSWLSTDPAHQLAYAHVLFNVSAVLACIGFTDSVARGLTWLIPDRAETVVTPAPTGDGGEPACVAAPLRRHTAGAVSPSLGPASS